MIRLSFHTKPVLMSDIICMLKADDWTGKSNIGCKKFSFKFSPHHHHHRKWVFGVWAYLEQLKSNQPKRLFPWPHATLAAISHSVCALNRKRPLYSTQWALNHGVTKVHKLKEDLRVWNTKSIDTKLNSASVCSAGKCLRATVFVLGKIMWNGLMCTCKGSDGCGPR